MTDSMSSLPTLYARKVCIIDDEPTVCAFLREALKDTYQVTVCNNGAQAKAAIDRDFFDLFVIDLILPDTTGIDLLRLAKSKDEYAEVIIITGYGSLDSAAHAMNLGASSYLAKPLNLEDFLKQVERATANRSFHLRSLTLMHHAETMTPEIASHLTDMTTLYRFSRRLLLSMEFPAIIQIILQDVLERTGASLGMLAINILDFSEIYLMSSGTRVDELLARDLIGRSWDTCCSFCNLEKFSIGEIPLEIFDTPQGIALDLAHFEPSCIPLMVKGRTIGTLTVFAPQTHAIDPAKFQFLHVYSSLIAALVEHAYLDMQSQLLAKTDSLTGIANYRMFQESLEREISRANRNKLTFTFVIIDIDDFKKVNDTYGHLVGNDVLKDLTSQIMEMIRKQDVFARYGGEEFALILPDTTLDGAKILCERIRAEIASHKVLFANDTVTYTISMGMAMYRGTEPIDKDKLIGNADKALYLSKSQGKNRITEAE